MDPWIWHEVRLELVEIDVKGSVESQRGRDRGYDLEMDRKKIDTFTNKKSY